MEPKVHYVIVGTFVVVLGLVAIGIVLWLGKTDYRGVYDRYHAYMRQSVSGLSLNSTVKYRGVDVGRVKEIALNPDNTEEVRLTLDILRGTPIKTDTIATLETQGLTGLATLNLAGQSRSAAPGNSTGTTLSGHPDQTVALLSVGHGSLQAAFGGGSHQADREFKHLQRTCQCLVE